jgi:hypothetical protein
MRPDKGSNALDLSKTPGATRRITVRRAVL